MSAIQVTERAEDQIKYLLDLCRTKAYGMRIVVSNRGCGGVAYDMDYVFDIESDDTKIVNHLFVKKKHKMWLMNTTIDYDDDWAKPSFVFSSPRMKGKCSCGDSYIV